MSQLHILLHLIGGEGVWIPVGVEVGVEAGVGVEIVWTAAEQGIYTTLSRIQLHASTQHSTVTYIYLHTY